MNNISATCLEDVQIHNDTKDMHFTQRGLEYAKAAIYHAEETIEAAKKSEELPSLKSCAHCLLTASFNLAKAHFVRVYLVLLLVSYLSLAYHFDQMLGDYSHVTDDEERIQMAHSTYLNLGGDPRASGLQELSNEWKEERRRWQKQVAKSKGEAVDQ